MLCWMLCCAAADHAATLHGYEDSHHAQRVFIFHWDVQHCHRDMIVLNWDCSPPGTWMVSEQMLSQCVCCLGPSSLDKIRGLALKHMRPPLNRCDSFTEADVRCPATSQARDLRTSLSRAGP